MNLRDEVKDIYENRPTAEDIVQERLERERLEKTYHRAGRRSRNARPGAKPLGPKAAKARLIITVLLLAAAAVFLVMLIVINPLPADLTIVLSIIMIGLPLLFYLFTGGNAVWKRVLGIFMALIFVVLFIPSSNFMVSTYAMFKKIDDGGIDATGPKALSVDVTNEPFNIYITGIDQWEEEKGLDLERSDVNMIVTVNPRTKKVLLTSIPRDTYVKLHTAQQMDKLTHTGVYGVDETLNTVHDWLGVDINYYLKMNFTAVRDVINAMGGIKVYSPVAFESDLAGYKYEKGWNRLSGREALYFARERHAFEGQDSVRVENQQRVVEAIIKKMTSSTTLLTRYGDIMKAAGDNLTTNMSSEEMTSLIRMQMGDLADWDVETQKIEGVYDQDYVASLTQSAKFDVYRPDAESVRKCVQNINDVMNPDLKDRSESRKNVSRSFFVNAVKRVFEKGEEETKK